ncbi:hypothetical protein Lp19_1228 [Lactiplantibacillus plantarum]|uniref:Uncharacterized protein n=1 Tax=Lactiplantibacillus plantarum TaxID=1590 RepID=A0A162F177_LACPN|nr:hypothetical protein [Lactiplantibacillus plantarum]KZU95949.1 hypothetical protein Lp19_1228 [Lactiplantibacillus plantarum]
MFSTIKGFALQSHLILGDSTDFAHNLNNASNSDKYFISKKMMEFVGPLQAIGGVVALICMIVCAIKLMTSSIFGDPRGRMGAITGVIIIIAAVMILVNANSLILMFAK